MAFHGCHSLLRQYAANLIVVQQGAYEERCDEVILLIEIHGFRSSSIANLDEAVRTHRFRSPFSRVLILLDGCEALELARAG